MHPSARHPPFFITTDPAAIDFDVVHGFLTDIYWCRGIPRDTLERACRHSICVSAFDESLPRSGPAEDAAGRAPRGRQVGFGRFITDRATFAYLSDVFVLESHRGRGISRLMLDLLLTHPDLQGLRRLCLLTRDSAGLYEKLGFGPLRPGLTYMERTDPGVYERSAVGAALTASRAGGASPAAGPGVQSPHER